MNKYFKSAAAILVSLSMHGCCTFVGEKINEDVAVRVACTHKAFHSDPYQPIKHFPQDCVFCAHEKYRLSKCLVASTVE